MIINKFEKRKEELSALSEISEYLYRRINDELNYEMYKPAANEETNTSEPLENWQIEHNERTSARISMYQKILDIIEKMV